MFTGLIRDIGVLKSIEAVAGGHYQLAIDGLSDTDGCVIGASIACDGICLTVETVLEQGFIATASTETLSKTTLGKWKIGKKINLEPSLKMGDALGGHFVFGHVDHIIPLITREMIADACKMEFLIPPQDRALVVLKGSVALNGVSLTVNAIEDRPDGCLISVLLVPHSLKHTNLQSLAVGDDVNFEADMLARYIARKLEDMPC